MEGFFKFFAAPVAVVVGFAGIVWYTSVVAEVRARNAVNAQVRVVEAQHDKMWKVLAQKAQISQQYRPSDYKDLLAEVVQGRQGGQFAKFVHEQNPGFDLSLLKDLMGSVESERAELLREERKLVDLGREHDNVIEDPVKTLFIPASRQHHIGFTVLTSRKTTEAFARGTDDEVDLFPATAR